MPTSTALIITDISGTEEQISALIDALPRKTHVSILVANPTTPLPLLAYGGPPYGAIIVPDDWQEEYEKLGAEVGARADKYDALLRREGIEGDVSSIYAEVSYLTANVTTRASLCDYAFIAASIDPGDMHFGNLIHGLLYDTPVGAVLNAGSVAKVLKAEHPFIAWDRSLPATRAVHRALPILKQAKQVTVAVVDPVHLDDPNGEPGADLAVWLSRHGCTVNLHQYPRSQTETGSAIITEAKECGADLVVMGAYGHSRMRQYLLGGTTETIIHQKDFPVLLVH